MELAPATVDRAGCAAIDNFRRHNPARSPGVNRRHRSRPAGSAMPDACGSLYCRAAGYRNNRAPHHPATASRPCKARTATVAGPAGAGATPIVQKLAVAFGGDGPGADPLAVTPYRQRERVRWAPHAYQSGVATVLSPPLSTAAPSFGCTSISWFRAAKSASSCATLIDPGSSSMAETRLWLMPRCCASAVCDRPALLRADRSSGPSRLERERICRTMRTRIGQGSERAPNSILTTGHR